MHSGMAASTLQLHMSTQTHTQNRKKIPNERVGESKKKKREELEKEVYIYIDTHCTF